MKSGFTRFMLILFIFIPFFTSAEPKFALVIGNRDYAEIPKLQNPGNDASDLASTLADLGFKVDKLFDVDLTTAMDAVTRFALKLSGSSDSVGFFFYAGHGVQSGGNNYLIPIGAHIPSEAFLRSKAIAVQEILDSLQGANNALNIVVLDACRNNPFSWSRGATRGLSVIGSQPSGSIVVYSTSAGSVAQDGSGKNGLFTAELLKQLKTPGLEITEVFKRTGAAVQDATHGQQVPAIYSQHFKNQYFAGAVASAVPTTSASAVSSKGRIVYGFFNDLYVSNADGSDAHRLTSQKGDGWPAWSPDGKFIAFSSWDRENRINPNDGSRLSSLYVMRSDGMEIRSLTIGDEEMQAPAWSPDGNHIAVEFFGGIMTMHPDGTEKKLIFNMKGFCCQRSAWSRDGAKLAVVGSLECPNTSQAGVYIVNADGTNPKMLSNTELSGEIAWSPDGGQIVMKVHTAGPIFRYYILRTDTVNDPIEVKTVPASWFGSYWPQWQ